MAGRPRKNDARRNKVGVSLADAYNEALQAWADVERRDKAEWANMLIEKLIDVRTLMEQGRPEEAEAILAEVKANCENRTRDLRFTKPLLYP